MSEYVVEVEYDTLNGTFSQKRCEEIVRCRDCEHCHEHDMRAYGGGCDQLLCHHFSMSSGAGWPVDPDGYCAWGERRDA